MDSGLNTPYDPTSVHTPLVREYSFGIQYEFAPGWVLDLGYVGSSGINLTDYNHNHNGAQIVTPGHSIIYGTLCTGGSNPSMQHIRQCLIPRAISRVTSRSGLAASDFDGYSKYNSLQATVRHQFSHGLSMQASYTWDKNLSDVFYANSANINDALALKNGLGEWATVRAGVRYRSIDPSVSW